MALSWYTIFSTLLNYVPYWNQKYQKKVFESNFCKAIQVNIKLKYINFYPKIKLIPKYGREARRILTFYKYFLTIFDLVRSKLSLLNNAHPLNFWTRSLWTGRRHKVQNITLCGVISRASVNNISWWGLDKLWFSQGWMDCHKCKNSFIDKAKPWQILY